MNIYEYKNVKNLMNLFEFCEKEIYVGNLWQGRYMLLLDAFYELENQNLLPESLELNDLIDFANEHSEARKLKEYLAILPGYEEIAGKNQCPSTVCQYGFIAMCGPFIVRNNTSYIIDPSKMTLNCSFRLEGSYKLIKRDGEKTLNIEFDNYKMTIKKLKTFPDKTYLIDGLLFKNIEFYELVNMITFAKEVEEFNQYSTQAAYSFLK